MQMPVIIITSLSLLQPAECRRCGLFCLASLAGSWHLPTPISPAMLPVGVQQSFVWLCAPSAVGFYDCKKEVKSEVRPAGGRFQCAFEQEDCAELLLDFSSSKG